MKWKLKNLFLFLLGLVVGFVSKDISLLLLFIRSVMLTPAEMQNCNSHVMAEFALPSAYLHSHFHCTGKYGSVCVKLFSVSE